MANKDDAPLTEAERETLEKLTRRNMTAQANQQKEEADARRALLKPLADAVNDPKITALIDAAQQIKPKLAFGDELDSHLPTVVSLLNRLRALMPQEAVAGPVVVPQV